MKDISDASDVPHDTSDVAKETRDTKDDSESEMSVVLTFDKPSLQPSDFSLVRADILILGFGSFLLGLGRRRRSPPFTNP
jgi:hypothetical protein